MNGSSKKASPKRNTITWSKLPEQPRRRTEANREEAAYADQGGKTILASLKPTALLAMFNTPQLKGVAQEVEDTIVKIMNEAASV